VGTRRDCFWRSTPKLDFPTYILLQFLPPTLKEEWRGKPSQESLFSIPAKDIETLDRDQVYGSSYRLTMIVLWFREYVDSISLSSDDAILFTRRTATVNSAAHRIALTWGRWRINGEDIAID
jgi:hypothetical protein